MRTRPAGKSFSFHKNERGRDRAGLESQVVTQLAASVGVVSCLSPSAALHPNPPSAVVGWWQHMQPAWLAEAVPQEKLTGESQHGHSCPPIPVAYCPQQELALPRPQTSSYLPADFSHASFVVCIINHTSTD